MIILYSMISLGGRVLFDVSRYNFHTKYQYFCGTREAFYPLKKKTIILFFFPYLLTVSKYLIKFSTYYFKIQCSQKTASQHFRDCLVLINELYSQIHFQQTERSKVEFSQQHVLKFTSRRGSYSRQLINDSFLS